MKGRLKYIKGSIAIIVVMLYLISFSVYSEAVPADSAANNKLKSISEEEQVVVQKLFVLNAEIELLQTEITQIETKIENYNQEIANKEQAIEDAMRRFGLLKSSLGDVLRSQQRLGAASSIEILLNASSVKDFMNRLNLLRDITRKVDQLMMDTTALSEKLTEEQRQLEVLRNEQELELASREKKLSEQINAKVALESYLSSLSEERTHYQNYLSAIEAVWNDLKPLFSKTVETFNTIIKNGDLPEDTVEVNLSLFNTKGFLYEDKFNEVLSKRSDLPRLVFSFTETSVELTFPDHAITLQGNFELIDNQSIRFKVTGGKFYGLSMSQSSIQDLFSEGDLVFELKALLGKNTIKKIEQNDGVLVLYVTINLF